MKKLLRVFATGALIASVATVASCGKKTKTTTTNSQQGTQIETKVEDNFKYSKKKGNGSNVDISVHYVNSSYHFGISYQGTEQATGLGGETLIKGQLLPMWATLGRELNYNIREAADLNAKDTKTEWQNHLKEGFKSGDNFIDLIMTDGDAKGSVTAQNSDRLLSIDALLDQGKLPNFQHWLETQGGGRKGALWRGMAAADGKVYYIPYFDGLNNIEKMFLMNHEWIEKLLDTTDNDANLSETAAKTSNFTAHVSAMTNEKIKVGKNEEITVNIPANKNIITQQNALQVKNGKNYVQTLRNYIDEVYMPTGKYTKRSEVFTSGKACYNSDDMIALMRCIVNNAKFLTGSEETIYAFAPRSGEGSRLRQLSEFTQIWGQRGVSAEKGKFYFDKDGNLQDARLSDSIYEHFDSLHELYKEGFFPGDFYTGYNNNAKTEWRSNLMKENKLFSVYDYNATTTGNNRDSLNSETGVNLGAVLPPVVKWDAPKSLGQNNYFHFTEDNRACKGTGFAIPKTSDNVDGACNIADYIYSPEGNDLQDYGPNTTSYRKAVTSYDENGHRLAGEGTFMCNGQITVKWADNVINATIGEDSFKKNWNNFCRKYIGSTQGIGHVRSDGVDFQSTTSAFAAKELTKMNQAIQDGVIVLCTTSSDIPFATSVPSGFALTAADNTAIGASNACTLLDTFWKEDSNANGKVVYCYWICKGKDCEQVTSVITNLSTFKSNFQEVKDTYLKAYRGAYLMANE